MSPAGAARRFGSWELSFTGRASWSKLYQTESSPDVRREILQAFFLAGDSGRLREAGAREQRIRNCAGAISKPG